MTGDEFKNALLNVWEKQQKDAAEKDTLAPAGGGTKSRGTRKRSSYAPGLIATAATIAVALIATFIVISVVKGRKTPAELPVQNASETPGETPVEPQFRGLEMLDDAQYVILKSDSAAIAALRPYQLKRTYRAIGSMTENDDNYTYTEKPAEGFIDSEGNIYVKARETMRSGGTDSGGDIYAVRVIDDETARQLLDTDGLGNIGERQAYVLMHMLAQYPRMRLINIRPQEPSNSFHASQKAVYFTDEHIVTCFMEQSAPLVFYDFETPYCTAVKVIGYAGNEWMEKPWLQYSADDFAVYARRVLEKVSFDAAGSEDSSKVWDEADQYRYAETPEAIYYSVTLTAGGSILLKHGKEMYTAAAISTFDRPKAEDDRTISFFGNEFTLKYIESLYMPLNDVFADSYYVKEKGRDSLIRIDSAGHVIRAEGFEILQLDIRPDDTADQVFEALTAAAGSYIDFTVFERTSSSNIGGTEQNFGIYDFLLSRRSNGIILETIQISVRSSGRVDFYSDTGIYNRNAMSLFTEEDMEKAMGTITAKIASAFEGSGYTLTGVNRAPGEDVKYCVFRGLPYLYLTVNYGYTDDATGRYSETFARVYLRLT